MMFSALCVADPFCAAHTCQDRCCTGCSAEKAKIIFIHVIKTGGSAVECAARSLAQQKIWINMGHTTREAVDACRAKCGKPAVAITVRNPFTYYVSMWRYTHDEYLAGKLGSNCANIMRSDKESGQLKLEQIEQLLSNFTAFLFWVTKRAPYTIITQGIAIACGDPCEYDYLLRTESLTDDFARMLREEGLPEYPLASVNPSSHSLEGTSDPILELYNCATVSLVNRLDENTLRSFGYDTLECSRGVVRRVPRPLWPPAPPPLSDQFACYPQRYPDLLAYCANSELERCDWAALKHHFENFGRAEGRSIECLPSPSPHAPPLAPPTPFPMQPAPCPMLPSPLRPYQAPGASSTMPVTTVVSDAVMGDWPIRRMIFGAVAASSCISVWLLVRQHARCRERAKYRVVREPRSCSASATIRSRRPSGRQSAPRPAESPATGSSIAAGDGGSCTAETSSLSSCSDADGRVYSI